MPRTTTDCDPCRITVCRGCCCGSDSRHPGVNHDGLLDDLRRRLSDRAELRTVGCLLVCDAANVVVVSPTRAARRSGARPVWLARVLDDNINREIATWISAGGPGVADIPSSLSPLVTRPFSYRRRSDTAVPTGT